MDTKKIEAIESDIREFFIKFPEAFLDPLRTKSVLQDLYEHDVPQVNRLMKAYQEQIVEQLLMSTQTEFSIQGYIHRLVEHQDMMEERAKIAVESWNRIIDESVVASFRNYKQELELKELVEDLPQKELTELEDISHAMEQKGALQELVQKYKKQVDMRVQALELRKQYELSIRKGLAKGSRLYSTREIHEMLEHSLTEPFVRYLERAPIAVTKQYQKYAQSDTVKEQLLRITKGIQ